MELNRPYFSGPLAFTDLHAGGVFFCVVYRECMRFEAMGRVTWWREVVDASRPYWEDVGKFEALTINGTYGRNDRGYLVCKFPNMEMTGAECDDATNLIAFYVWHSSQGLSESRVFHSPNVKAVLDSQLRDSVDVSPSAGCSQEVATTTELLRICDEDGRSDSFVDSIRDCLKALLEGNAGVAAKHFRSVPLGGMGRFDDWRPANASNAALFDQAIQKWVTAMRLHVPIEQCPACGKLKHPGPCFEYFGE
ncbi:hypothetical protein [Rhodoferax mekongensis]|uniref:Uncharacterized protein n=1 Tax=Rhodoferax mekongensis TaxID=3068341 RepID=A0ABZ0AV68_9BURK|nr:hypothetical protein [Rhodoferax sp. TBRC 17307]WNO03521.1 hypothetical protein RAN89_11375 [Rhodoferax sp. TBRC 17307]